MTEIQPDRSDPNRCISVHWSLPFQCELPSSHFDYWHEGTNPDNGIRTRYRRSGVFATEALSLGEWYPIEIPRPLTAAEKTEQEIRQRIADAIQSLKQDYKHNIKAWMALDHARNIALGPKRGLCGVEPEAEPREAPAETPLTEDLFCEISMIPSLGAGRATVTLLDTTDGQEVTFTGVYCGTGFRRIPANMIRPAYDRVSVEVALFDPAPGQDVPWRRAPQDDAVDADLEPSPERTLP